MKKKGVSPLIATVLLIGFAVALAAVVMTWGLDFIKGTQDATDKATKNTLICATDVTFAISDVSCSNFEITVDNRGQADITSLILRVYNANGVDSIDTSELGFLSNQGVAKFAVKKFKDDPAYAGTSTPLTIALQGATKVEAIATVSGPNGEEDVTCAQNVQTYVISPACP